MKAEDLIPAGERAKRHLRVAQALAMLSKTRAPSLSRVKDALSRVQAKQPAVAMAVILEYAKRHPLHERGDWLKAAGEALQEYRLSEDADQKEAELARDHIEHEVSLHKAEIEKIEKMRERFSMGLLFLLLLLMAGTLIYIGHSFNSKQEGEETKKDTTATPKSAETKQADTKPDHGKTNDKKTDLKRETEKAPAAEAKKTDKDAKPAGK